MVSVSVVKISGKPYFYAQYRDEITGKKIRKSTKEKTRRKAERFAANWEKEIQAGTGTGISWADFRERFTLEHCITKRDKTAKSYQSVLDQLEEFATPRKLKAINADYISQWRVHLVKIGVSESTRATYLRTLKAALNWAHSVNLIGTVPTFPREKRKDTGKHRGRALTDAEIQTMIDTVPMVVSDPAACEAYQRLIEGLSLSGLRVGESQQLSWDSKTQILADINARYPVFKFPGSMQKNGKTETVPMAPDFASFLKKTPKKDRHGKVMAIPVNPTTGEGYVSAEHVAKVIARVGKATGISTGEGQTPTAHDLRRSFATRWSRRVLPATLKVMMRHSSISTTMAYYVASETEAIGAELAKLDL